MTGTGSARYIYICVCTDSYIGCITGVFFFAACTAANGCAAAAAGRNNGTSFDINIRTVAGIIIIFS